MFAETTDVLAVCGVLTLLINVIFAPLVAFWIARMSARLAEVKKINDDQTDKIDTVIAETNGLKKELVEATKSGALAEGKLAGIAEERAAQADKP